MLSKLLIASTTLVSMTVVAAAADLPSTKGPPVYVPAPPVFSWTGLYLGAQVGAAWNSGGFDDSADPNIEIQSVPYFHTNDTGVIAGGHIGYNYQISQFVLGVEGSFSYIGIDRTDEVAASDSTGYFSTRQNWIGTIGARIGYAFDRVLIYADGGAAFTRYNISESNNWDAFNYSSDYAGGHTRVGWTVGGGIEYALTDNWIVGVDYKYYDFGSRNLSSGYFTPPYDGQPAGPGFDVFRVHESENSVTARVSYKFDFLAPPVQVVAKY